MTQPFYPDLWKTTPRAPGSRTGGLRDEAGTSFDDKFALTAKLGDGMTAVVYVATDRKTGRTCACKLAERKPHRPHWSRLTQVLKHESALLQRIGEHPGIVRWQGFFLGATQMALVLELVSGGDCQQLLQRQGCLAEEAVHTMMRQLRDALEHLHSQQVLHRDVKLENLLVNNEVWPPLLKLCDFGHACDVHTPTDDETEFYGTPGYAAPEVASGPVWSYAADVWAMGIVMYALLGNALPFEREYSWLRPPDFSGRAWWQVSVEAKLLLQSILDSEPGARASLASVGLSDWIVDGPQGRSGGKKARPTFGRRGYGSMASLGDAVPPAQLAHKTAAALGLAGNAASMSDAAIAGGAAAESRVPPVSPIAPAAPAALAVDDEGVPEVGPTMTQFEAMQVEAAPEATPSDAEAGEGGVDASPDGRRRDERKAAQLRSVSSSVGAGLDMLGLANGAVNADDLTEEEHMAERQLERQRLDKMREALRVCRMQGMRGSMQAASAIRER